MVIVLLVILIAVLIVVIVYILYKCKKGSLGMLAILMYMQHSGKISIHSLVGHTKFGLKETGHDTELTEQVIKVIVMCII